MPRVSHLIRRNGIYWFKIDLPDDLAGLPLPLTIPQTIKQLESPTRLGRFKTAVWLSLKTTVEREAIQLLISDISRDPDSGVWTLRFDREGDKPHISASRFAA